MRSTPDMYVLIKNARGNILKKLKKLNISFQIRLHYRVVYYQSEVTGNFDRFLPFLHAGRYDEECALSLLHNTGLCPAFQRNTDGLVHVFADRDICRVGIHHGNPPCIVLTPHVNFYALRHKHPDGQRHLDACPDPWVESYEKFHYMHGTYTLHSLPPTMMIAPACSNGVLYKTGESGKKSTVIGHRSNSVYVVNPQLGWRGGAMHRYRNQPAFEVSSIDLCTL